jgi:transposase-like protein
MVDGVLWRLPRLQGTLKTAAPGSRGYLVISRTLKPLNRMSEAEFVSAFPVGDEESCRAYLVAMRWPDGVRCPRCNNERVLTLGRPFQWNCKACSPKGYNFSEKIGTIFESTKISLRTWYEVLRLILLSESPVNAFQVWQRFDMRSTRTAWTMTKVIRFAIAKRGAGTLGNVVELDPAAVRAALATYDRAKARPKKKRDRRPRTM